jgi:hypothetical protein
MSDSNFDDFTWIVRKVSNLFQQIGINLNGQIYLVGSIRLVGSIGGGLGLKRSIVHTKAPWEQFGKYKVDAL